MPDTEPRTRQLPPPADLHVVRRDVASIVDLATALAADYGWLWPSATTTPRQENHERTRREVTCDDRDLGDDLSRVASVRHHLAVASKDVAGALALLRGARKALSKAEGAVDRQIKSLVADEPAVPGPDEVVDLEAARKAQRRRALRADPTGLPAVTAERDNLRRLLGELVAAVDAGGEVELHPYREGLRTQRSLPWQREEVTG